MISVVIPSYNKEKFISETIESVLRQTFENFEIILVDDGSTDNSVSIVKAINDTRIKIYEIENSGVSVARNLGIAKAAYNYVAFLDADDWWDIHFLAEMSAAIKKFPDEKIFASGRSRVFKNSTDRYQNKYLPSEGETALVSYFDVISVDLPAVNSSNSVFHKSLFLEIGKFKVGVSQHEDHDLWIRLAAKNNIVFINKNLSFYRKTEGNTASKNLYEASHFLKYLQSMCAILPQLSDEEKTSFLVYTNRFIPFSFLKNSSYYSSKDRKTIIKQSKPLVSSRKLSLLKIASHLSFLHLYKIYKWIRS